MKLLSLKWRTPTRPAKKIEEKQVSEDLLAQISGGLGKRACHTGDMP